MNYRPLPEGLTIRESEIQGLGLFSTQKIKKGVIGIGWVKNEYFPNGYVRTPLGGFVNHSDDPNCTKMVHDGAGVVWLEALRDIEPEEELTTKYSFYRIFWWNNEADYGKE